MEPILETVVLCLCEVLAVSMILLLLIFVWKGIWLFLFGKDEDVF